MGFSTFLSTTWMEFKLWDFDFSFNNQNLTYFFKNLYI